MENNEVNVNESNQSGISLRLLWDVFKRCWYWMLIGAVLAGGLSLWYFNKNFVPSYSVTSKFYISNVASTTYLYSAGQIDGAASMAEQLATVITDNNKLAGIISADIELRKSSDNVPTIVRDIINATSGGTDLNLLEELLNNQIATDRKSTPVTQSSQFISPNTVKRMISATNDGAMLSVKVSGTDKKKIFLVAQSLEEWVPRFCDDINNQPDALSYAHQSKSLNLQNSVSETGYSDSLFRSENSRSDIYRYPLFITIFVAVAIYGIFLLIVIMNTTIYSAADIKAISPKYSVIGSIEHWALSDEKKWGRRAQTKADILGTHVDQKLILREKAPFRIQEGFHELRTNVTFCAAGEKGCTIGVASSIAGSGKSFVMANLAVSLSNLYDKRVLLVDGDLRRPMLHKIFALQNKVGLSNLIAGMELSDADLKHSFDRLDVITAGTLPPNPIDLLSSPRMKEMLAKWKTEYDYILIDLPPVGEVADMFAISDMISGYIYVVRSGYTDSRILRDTTETITSKNAKIFGYVVTDVHPERMEGYTRYSYYYRYYKYGYYNRYKSYSSYAKAANENGGAQQPEEKHQSGKKSK